jgi:hypothetical protein
MVDFNSIINPIILIVIFVGIGWILFRAFKPMLAGLGGLIGRGWGKVKDQASHTETFKQNYVDYQ